MRPGFRALDGEQNEQVQPGVGSQSAGFMPLVGYLLLSLSVLGKNSHCRKEDPLSSSEDACVALDEDVGSAPAPENEMLSLKPLSSFPGITDFQLPEEDFGPLKLEKLKSCSGKPSEPSGSRRSRRRHLEDGNCVAVQELTPQPAARDVEDLGEQLTLRPGQACRQMPKPGCQHPRKGLSSPTFLFTPSATLAPDNKDTPTTDACSPALPLVGTTPALGSQAPWAAVSAELVAHTCSPAPLSPLKAPVSLAGDRNPCASRTSPPRLDGSLHVSGQPSWDCDSGPQATPLLTESFTFEENQLCADTRLEPWRCPTKQVWPPPL